MLSLGRGSINADNSLSFCNVLPVFWQQSTHKKGATRAVCSSAVNSSNPSACTCTLYGEHAYCLRKSQLGVWGDFSEWHLAKQCPPHTRVTQRLEQRYSLIKCPLQDPAWITRAYVLHLIMNLQTCCVSSYAVRKRLCNHKQCMSPARGRTWPGNCIY